MLFFFILGRLVGCLVVVSWQHLRSCQDTFVRVRVHCLHHSAAPLGNQSARCHDLPTHPNQSLYPETELTKLILMPSDKYRSYMSLFGSHTGGLRCTDLSTAASFSTSFALKLLTGINLSPSPFEPHNVRLWDTNRRSPHKLLDLHMVI